MGVRKTTFEFSNPSITLDGESTNINLTRDDQSYTNKLSHGFGDIYTYPEGSTDYTWAPTAQDLIEFWNEVPTKKSRLIDVYLDTYNGSTKVGRDVHSLEITLSEDTGRPIVSNFTITDSNKITNRMGIIIPGKSNLSSSFSATGKYGASISNNTYVYGSNEYEDINSLIGALPLTITPTQYNITCKATDSRGFSTTETISKPLTIAQYQAPEIDIFDVIRCDSTGAENDNGTSAKVIIKGFYAPMEIVDDSLAEINPKNNIRLRVGYKTKSDDTYTELEVSQYIEDTTGPEFNCSCILPNVTFNANEDYVFSIKLSDSFTSVSKDNVSFLNTDNILYISADGKELVIGNDGGNNVLVDNDGLDIRNKSEVLASFNKDNIELGKNSPLTTIRFCNDKGFVRAREIYHDEYQIELVGEQTGLYSYAEKSSDGTALEAQVATSVELDHVGTNINNDIAVVQTNLRYISPNNDHNRYAVINATAGNNKAYLNLVATDKIEIASDQIMLDAPSIVTNYSTAPYSGDILAACTLWTGSGTSGTCSDSILNYKKIEIYFRKGNGNDYSTPCSSVSVWDPSSFPKNGSRNQIDVTLSMSFFVENANTMQNTQQTLEFMNECKTFNSVGRSYYINSSNASLSTNQHGYPFLVYAIIGYK